MKVALLGANGQLGVDLARAARERGLDLLPLTHAEIRIEDRSSVEAAIPAGTEVVVNTAAFHNLDRCEEDPRRAFEVNAIGPLHLARVTAARGVRLVHISTDYVFGGEKRTPYVEDDLPGPLSVYAISKAAGEHAALSAEGSVAVVRVCGIYGSAPCRAKGGDNFVKTMLRLGKERGKVEVVNDQWVTPTYTRPLAKQVLDIAARDDLRGVVHATADGSCSWYEFALAIFEEAGMDVQVTPVTSAAYPSKVRRPAYSVLENARLKALGLDRIPHWRSSLREYLGEIGVAT